MMRNDQYMADHLMKSSMGEKYRIPGWRVRGPLQSGAQAHTFIVSRTETPASFFVAKVFRDSGPGGYAYAPEEQRWRFLREVTLLQLLGLADCPGVVSVVEFGLRTENTDNPWYIMPLYRAGAMRKYDPDEDRFVYREDYAGNVDRVMEIAEALAETLAVMHEHPSASAHRDLNMSNILFDEEGGRPILADFGIAHLDGFMDRPSADEPIFSGAWHWRPPELETSEDQFHPAGDIYMLGGIIYEALTGGDVCAPQPLRPDVVSEQLAIHTADERVHAISELLCRMLARDPEHRPSALEVQSIAHEIQKRCQPRRHEQMSMPRWPSKQVQRNTTGSPAGDSSTWPQNGSGSYATV